MPKKRLDALLVDMGLAQSLDHAAKLILAGEVLVDNQRLPKAGTLIDDQATVRLAERQRYVSRGGEKLKAAIDHFGIAAKGRVVIDIGASAGGFCDCFLQEGAVKVYAVDVGVNELDWRLRNDPRIKNLSGINARALEDLPEETFSPKPTIAAVDVSFISATLILTSLRKILTKGSDLLILVKPQFELPREDIEPGGVVRDPQLHKAACAKVEDHALAEGYSVLGTYASPVKGRKKANQEFFIYLTLG